MTTNDKQLFMIRATHPAPDLNRLAQMGPQAVQQLYRETFNCDLAGGSTEQARRKIAWHIQAGTEGGLPESARQRALAIARDSKRRLRIGANVERRAKGLALKHAVTTTIVADCDARLPMPGSILIKKLKDRTVIVKVLTSGFEYEGRRYQSLSAIAGEVTGTKWNGFVFCGLGKEGIHGR